MRTAISLVFTGLVFTSLSVNLNTFITEINSESLSGSEQLHAGAYPRTRSPRKPKKRNPYRGSGRRELITQNNYAI